MKYSGGWYFDKFHGKGVLVDKEGNVTEGQWNMGQIVEVEE